MTNTATQTLAVANVFIIVDDHDKALTFYRDVLGLSVTNDVRQGGFRWLTVVAPESPGVEVTLQSVDVYPGVNDRDREAMSELLAKGAMSAIIFAVDDVDALFEHVAASGAEVLQEPTDQFYGVRDCAFRDPAGNMVRFKSDLPQG